MPTVNDQFLEATINHMIGLERYKAQQVRQIMTLLNATEEDLRNQMIQRLNRIIDAGGFDAGPATTRRLRELMKEIGAIREEGYLATGDLLRKQLTDLAAYEALWTTTTIANLLPVELSLAMPTAEQLHAAVFSKPFNGHLFEDWVTGMLPADLDRIERTISMGVVEGKPIDQMVREIVGTRAAGYKDGILEMSRRGAEAVVRTAVNHTVSAAHDETYKANSDIITGVRWLSTLDGRTTLVCIKRDGEIYPLGSGPRPPAHWNCRSTTVPCIDGIKIVATRPSYAGFGRKKAKELIGQEPGNITYEQWFAKQSVQFQDELLGPTRGKLYRDGGLKLDKFTDASGKTYTLDQLRRRDANAFKRAKI